MKKQLEEKQQLFAEVVVPDNLHADPSRALKPCAQCGETAVRRIYDQAHFPVVRCRGCGLMYADEHFTNEDLARFYSGDYYRRAYVCHPPQIDEQIANDYLRVFRRVDRETGGGRMLDFGSARGTFIGHLAKSDIGARWQVEGVDINADEIDIGRRQGHPVRVANVLANGLEDDTYDVITAFSVIEHLQDPETMLRALWHALKPGGRFLMIVPNGECLIIDLGLWAHRLSGGRLRSFSDNVFHEEHIYYFAPKTLPRFLAKCGYETTYIGFQPSYLEAHAPSWPLRLLGGGLRFLSWAIRRQTMLVAIARKI